LHIPNITLATAHIKFSLHNRDFQLSTLNLVSRITSRNGPHRKHSSSFVVVQLLHF
jgi:hypothetical protein